MLIVEMILLFFATIMAGYIARTKISNSEDFELPHMFSGIVRLLVGFVVVTSIKSSWNEDKFKRYTIVSNWIILFWRITN